MDTHTWAVSLPNASGTATLSRSPFGCEIKVRNANGVVVKKFEGKTEEEVRAACTAQYPPLDPAIQEQQAAYDAWRDKQDNGAH